MASKYLQKYPVPEGFHQILHDFAREVLRDQPEDIIKYGADYFECMKEGKEFKFESKFNIAKGQAPGKHYKPPRPEDKSAQAREVVEKSNARPQSTQRVASANPGDVSMGSQGSHPDEKNAAKEYVNDLYAKITDELDVDQKEDDVKIIEEQYQQSEQQEQKEQQEQYEQYEQQQQQQQQQEQKPQEEEELPQLNTFNDKDLEKIVKIQAAAKGTISRKQQKERNAQSQKQIPQQPEVQIQPQESLPAEQFQKQEPSEQQQEEQ